MNTPLRTLTFDRHAILNRNDVEFLEYLSEKMWDVENRDDDCKNFHNSLYALYIGFGVGDGMAEYGELYDDLLRLGASYLSVCDLMHLRELVSKIKTSIKNNNQ